MKKKGHHCDFRDERDKALLAVWRGLLRSAPGPVRADDLYRVVANAPAPRFYVSTERVAAVARNPGAMAGMRPRKRAMFSELLRRMAKRQEGESEAEAIFRIVYSPAPSFYLAPEYVKELVLRAKRKAREGKRHG